LLGVLSAASSSGQQGSGGGMTVTAETARVKNCGLGRSRPRLPKETAPAFVVIDEAADCDLERVAALDVALREILEPPKKERQRKPRRQRKPSLARLVAKAKQLGVDVTIEPNGAATFRTGGAPVDKPQTEVDEWIAKRAH
jgi:hypothetical protein